MVITIQIPIKTVFNLYIWVNYKLDPSFCKSIFPVNYFIRFIIYYTIHIGILQIKTSR
jgi:hypothetical protein